MSPRNRLFVLAAPSGAGKTTLVRELVGRHPEYRFSISYTTRAPRAKETNGKDYFFVDPDEFARLRGSGELLESALVFDNYYGTGRSQVETHLSDGRPVILEIDWQGARQVAQSMPEAVSIFILPPSRPELERRLRGRKTDTEQVIRRRLDDALADMSHWDEFNYVVINEDLDRAVGELEAVFAGHGDANRSDNPELRRRVEKILV